VLTTEAKAFLWVNESLDIQDIKSVYIEIEKDQQSLCKPVSVGSVNDVFFQ
jgi:hypothetical protein